MSDDEFVSSLCTRADQTVVVVWRDKVTGHYRQITVTPAEKDRLQRIADKLGLQISELIRQNT